MSKVVLDASTLLALVNQDLGQAVVAELLPRLLVSAVTDQGVLEGEVQEVLAALNVTVVTFDEGLGLVAKPPLHDGN